MLRSRRAALCTCSGALTHSLTAGAACGAEGAPAGDVVAQVMLADDAHRAARQAPQLQHLLRPPHRRPPDDASAHAQHNLETPPSAFQDWSQKKRGVSIAIEGGASLR